MEQYDCGAYGVAAYDQCQAPASTSPMVQPSGTGGPTAAASSAIGSSSLQPGITPSQSASDLNNSGSVPAPTSTSTGQTSVPQQAIHDVANVSLLTIVGISFVLAIAIASAILLFRRYRHSTNSYTG